MKRGHVLLVVAIALLAAGAAAADTKIVQAVHQDAFTVMGQSQPAADSERVIWLGGNRLRVDEDDSTMIVRLDTATMYMIDHAGRTVSAISLPVDPDTLLPPGVADQMRAMMQLSIAVSPTEETKKVGGWTARRWNVTMTTPMVTIERTLWATKDVDVDRAAYDRLFHQIASLQPGAEKLVEEQSVTRMPGSDDVTMTRTEKTMSVETLDPPVGAYEPPSDYSERDFDLMSAMSGGR